MQPFLKYQISIVLMLVYRSSAKLPDEIEKCDINDSQCITNRMNTIFTDHYNGIQGVLPTLDPLYIDKMEIIRGQNSPISLALYYNSVNLYGFSKVRMQQVSGFTENPTKIKFTYMAPYYVMSGNYKGSGTILIIPVTGHGKSNITLGETQSVLKLTGKLVEKKGKEYYQVDKIKLDLKTKKFGMHYENLFNGNKQLGDQVNSFLNQNWEEIWKEMVTSIEDIFEQIFKNIINRFFSKIPYRELFN